MRTRARAMRAAPRSTGCTAVLGSREATDRYHPHHHHQLPNRPPADLSWHLSSCSSSTCPTCVQACKSLGVERRKNAFLFFSLASSVKSKTNRTYPAVVRFLPGGAVCPGRKHEMCNESNRLRLRVLPLPCLPCLQGRHAWRASGLARPLRWAPSPRALVCRAGSSRLVMTLRTRQS